MNPVCLAFDGNFHVIIHDKGHAVFRTQRLHFNGFLQKIFLIQFLFSQLYTGRAALQCILNLLH